MDVFTLVRVAVLGKTGHSLQWWEKRKRRVLPLLDFSRDFTGNSCWTGLNSRLVDLWLLQEQF